MGESKILRLGSVTSTQDVARELPLGSIVIADHQTHGRGRMDRRWEEEAGTALLVSFVLEPDPLLSLTAGVAAAEACGPTIRLKWPNDLLLDGRKLGGILVEATPRKAICGIGINLTWAPEGGAMLREPREAVFARLRDQISKWTRMPAESILNRWRQRADTLGRRVRLTLTGSTVEGTATGIGAHGELIIDGVAYVAGSLTHL